MASFQAADPSSLRNCRLAAESHPSAHLLEGLHGEIQRGWRQIALCNLLAEQTNYLKRTVEFYVHPALKGKKNCFLIWREVRQAGAGTVVKKRMLAKAVPEGDSLVAVWACQHEYGTAALPKKLIGQWNAAR